MLIQTVGATSYAGYVNATTEQLTSDITSTVLSTKLWLGASELTNYYVKWYRDNTLWLVELASFLTIRNAPVVVFILNTPVLSSRYPSASVVLLKLRVTPLYCHWWNDKATDAPLADVTLGTSSSYNDSWIELHTMSELKEAHCIATDENNDIFTDENGNDLIFN